MGNNTKTESYPDIFLITAFGMVGSILAGLLFHGISIFNHHSPDFQFITMGFSGALLFGLLKYQTPKEQIFCMIFILILHLIIFTGKAFSWAFLVRDVCFLGALFLSIKIYHEWLKRNQMIFYLRVLALVLIYGLLNILAITIIFLIHGGLPPVSYLYSSARYGIFIGLGIGLGMDFYLSNRTKIISLLKITRL